jgi:hypothetical protein
VKHDYEAPWDALKPHLSTCNPGSMTYVTHGLSPQIVEEGEEIIFSYDVIFKVHTLFPSCGDVLANSMEAS